MFKKNKLHEESGCISKIKLGTLFVITSKLKWDGSSIRDFYFYLLSVTKYINGISMEMDIKGKKRE